MWLKQNKKKQQHRIRSHHKMHLNGSDGERPNLPVEVSWTVQELVMKYLQILSWAKLLQSEK